MSKVFKTLAVATVFFLAACTSVQKYISHLTGVQAAKEKEIAALKVEYDTKLNQKTTEISDTKDKVIASKDKQIKAAVNGLYAADMVFNTIIAPTRTDLVTNNYVNESWVALGHAMPDYDTLLIINERVKKELDETKTSLDDLKRSHAAVIGQNQQLVQQTKALQDKIIELQNERDKISDDYNQKLREKQTELLALKDKIIAKEKELADNATAIKEAKTKFSTVLGIVSLACLAGAIWLPVFKEKCGIMAAITGGAAVGIWFIQPWMVGAALGVSILLVAAWAIYRFHVSDKTNNAYINFVHDIQATNPALYAQLEPTLTAWLTKYAKDNNGNIITVPDKSILSLVNDKLVTTDKK